MVETCSFYWVIDGKLAGSAYPGQFLGWLYNTQGIRAILSLQPLTSDDLIQARKLGFETKTIEIIDFTAGSPEQRETAIQQIDEFQEKGLPTLVHCQGGLGRTGMILALYLVQRKAWTPESAIAHIRRLRKGSIEVNTGQEEAILGTDSDG
jgi:atypical dual specificity phosphatase